MRLQDSGPAIARRLGWDRVDAALFAIALHALESISETNRREAAEILGRMGVPK